MPNSTARSAGMGRCEEDGLLPFGADCDDLAADCDDFGIATLIGVVPCLLPFGADCDDLAADCDDFGIATLIGVVP